MKKPDIVLLVFGSGGHKEQMKRLYKLMNTELKQVNKDIKFITVSEKNYPLNSELENYEIPEIRNKHSRVKTILNLPIFFKDFIKIMLSINKKYNVKTIVSTGPGIIIPISIFFKIKTNVNILFIETWSRFETQSITGKIMYKIADKFYIQNKSLKKIYPNSIYGGLL